mmetsp:Transcript_31949/g.44548  ORF Transcript_31949/g.44548 Transcript_31949/m.44548 type:complete len:129 (+) Transcript_31949:258-644(+)
MGPLCWYLSPIDPFPFSSATQLRTCAQDGRTCIHPQVCTSLSISSGDKQLQTLPAGFLNLLDDNPPIASCFVSGFRRRWATHAESQERLSVSTMVSLDATGLATTEGRVGHQSHLHIGPLRKILASLC